jgi:hypothetical protein
VLKETYTLEAVLQVVVLLHMSTEFESLNTARMHAHAHAHTHTHTHTNTHTHKHTRTRARAQTHKRAHTHAHTHNSKRHNKMKTIFWSSYLTQNLGWSL